MKKNYLLLIFCFITYFTNAQAPFITTWNVLDGDTIIVPIVEDDDIPDSYTIDFGDGTVLTNQSGSVSHTYSSTGIYTVTISGDFTRIVLGGSNPNSTNASKLLTIEQWGDVQWTSMERAFQGCLMLTVTATDTPDLSNVTDMSYMFSGADSFNQPIDSWEVSNVSDMSYMFFSADSFNQPLNNWDVSNVTVIYRMFSNAASFNQPLNNWDVSGVTNMDGMFDSAVSFNQSLNSWDVSNVTDMTGMFGGATSFNQPLNDWDVSGVTRMDSMFLLATSFNQPLDNWDVSNVTNMRQMFYIATSFNQDISTWNFNENVTFSIPGSFVRSSGLDVNNYDALLNRFKELELENKWLDSGYLQYCDEETRSYLINNLGWTIEDDSLAEDCTAKTELFSIEQLSIYPNPVNNILHIETKLGIQLEAVTIYNLQGSQLIHLNQDFENINTESLSSGIYILSIQTDKGSTEYKLIKN